MSKKVILIGVPAGLLLLISAGAWNLLFAGGFMIPHQTARGLSLGNAMTAGVNDPSAVYYNPGALGEVAGNNVLLTGSYAGVYSGVENGGRRAVNKHDDNFLATLFANYHIPNSDFTIGMGTYSPFGLATTYEREFTRFAAERTELKTIYVTPALSWHPSQFFALGAGVSFVHASGLFSRSLCLAGGGACAVPAAQGRLRVTDTADAFTYNLGLLLKPTESLKLGFSYRARADIRFDSADVKLGGVLAPFGRQRAHLRPIPLPPVLNAGLSWQINSAWSAEFVYEHARWSEFKQLSASFSPPLPLPGFRLPEDWKNTSTLRLGTSYKIDPHWELRGGLTVEETPIPSRTLNPAIPGADLLTLNAGVGYKWQNFGIDLGYMAVFYKTRTVTNNQLEGLPATGFAFPGAPGKDKYDTFNNFVSLSVSYKF
ncbi:MAG TPA: outer membrane protein transport protein [Candidatus Binatia bacterium]|nr:outer membrane protein transport protein [Candidatus Binatia bacterium]